MNRATGNSSGPVDLTLDVSRQMTVASHVDLEIFKMMTYGIKSCADTKATKSKLG